MMHDILIITYSTFSAAFIDKSSNIYKELLKQYSQTTNHTCRKFQNTFISYINNILAI
ncbi:hypothetical protein BDC45DRAFT_502333 [Circinella umbellata]|nr:hypothetical protein BDC45DRAFT_502333 [Circinella umbellata]